MKKTISLILCALLLVALCACGKTENTPTSVVRASLDALKNGTSDDSSMFGNVGGIAGGDDAMYAALFGSLTYTVKGERVNGDRAEVDLDVSTADIPAALNAYLVEAGNHAGDDDWDADGSYFVTLLSSPDAARKDFSVTAHLVMTDGEWVLPKEENNDLLNAATGGLYDFANTAIEE